MDGVLFAFSRQGCRTGQRVLAALAGESFACFAPERLEEPGFAPLGKPAKPFYGELFAAKDALIFVGSVGIAVREIAPHVKSKATDPAVVVTDELGRFVIPVLSGHLGGANALAKRLAGALGAVPVITTATDINCRFSVDTFARDFGYALSSLPIAKAVSAAVLEGDVPIASEFPLPDALPAGLRPGESGPLGIYIGCRDAQPFEKTLRLIPKMLHLGLGCRRGTEAAAIAEAVSEMLEENRIDPRAIKCAASIDLKADEAGLLAFCAARKLPAAFYPAETLRQVPGDFTPSEFVKSVTGVDNVCERAALLGADTLIVKKAARHGVTAALAAESWEVRFE